MAKASGPAATDAPKDGSKEVPAPAVPDDTKKHAQKAPEVPPAAAEVASEAEAPAVASAAPAAPAPVEEAAAAAEVSTTSVDGATALPPVEGAAPGDAEAAAPAVEEVEIPEEPEDVPGSFQSAREAVRRIHTVLDKLLVCKQGSGDASAETFSEYARSLQLEILAMRRTHRSMVKAADQGRASETAARRKVDSALAHLETRRYESGCLRMTATRCRTFPTPDLDKLRPNLQDGAQVEGDDPDDEDISGSPSAPSGKLAERLEAERKERESLDAELQELERVKATEVEAIRELQAQKTEFASLVTDGLRAFEPALNLLEVRSRPSGQTLPYAGVLSSLPTALRVVYAKFENIASHSKDSGVSVSLEGCPARKDGPPPEKKARTTEAAEMTVCVKISHPKSASASKACCLRFTSPVVAAEGTTSPPIVKVAAEAASGEKLLDCLWPEDDGSKTIEPDGVAELPGRAYYWAQVLAGLRDKVTTSAPALAAIGGVSAMDVATKVRAKMAAK